MTHARSCPPRDDLVATPHHPTTPNHPYGDRAAVLLEANDQHALDETPTAICCPNCGEAVTVYEQGLPTVVPHLDIACGQCDVELRVWCVVAVDAAYLSIVEPSTLTAMVQRFWDDWLWGGITNSKGEPRNDEYTSRLAEKASAFGWDWDVSCPLCRRSLTTLNHDGAIANGSLDYHHWSHDPDQGICLCRECHDIIGFDTYDTELEDRAEAWGFDSRHDLQIIRLGLRHAAVTGRPLEPWHAPALVDRYNLPQSVERIDGLLRAICTDEQLCDAFLDARLVAGVDS